jgi:hypothetical protein
MDEALADYEERRNTASRILYQENVEAARLMPLPEAMTNLLTALHGREEDTRQFHLARQGSFPLSVSSIPTTCGESWGARSGAPRRTDSAQD